MKAKTAAQKIKRLRELAKQWSRANDRESSVQDKRNNIIKERTEIINSLSKSDAALYAEKIDRTDLPLQ